METFGEIIDPDDPRSSVVLTHGELVDLGIMVDGMRHWIDQAITLCGE